MWMSNFDFVSSKNTYPIKRGDFLNKRSILKEKSLFEIRKYPFEICSNKQCKETCFVS